MKCCRSYANARPGPSRLRFSRSPVGGVVAAAGSLSLAHLCSQRAQDSSRVASPGITSDGGIRHAHEFPQESPVPTPVGFHDIHHHGRNEVLRGEAKPDPRDDTIGLAGVDV